MVERLLAKEEVAGSTPVFRSTLTTSRALATSALVAQARARDAGCDAAEVAEWQTRRSQKPLGFTARVGSTPTFGTSHPGTRGEFRRRGTKHSMTIQRVSPWKYWRPAWAQGQYAYVALPASIPRPVAGLLALLYTLLLLLLPNVYGPLYTLPGGRASVRISPLRGRLRHVAVFLPVVLASMTVVLSSPIAEGVAGSWIRLCAVLLMLVALPNVLAVVGISWRARRFTRPIDHYADTLIRWRFGPGRGPPGDGDRLWSLVRDLATREGWLLGLHANSDEIRDEFYFRHGMVLDDPADPKAARRLVFDGRAARAAGQASAATHEE